jgi:hypothetical protein
LLWLLSDGGSGKVFTHPVPSEDLTYLSEGAKMGLVKATFVCALALVAVLSLFAAPVSALDRSDGDYWVYEGGMEFEGIEVSGSFRYEFDAKDSLTVGSESYEVDVLKVTGSMSGETEDLLGMSASVEVVFYGFSYEVDGSLATVKEDMYIWANMTIGTGSFALVTKMEMQDVTTYSPPTLSGFVDGETGTGDEWDETTNVTTESSFWIDDVMDDTSTDEYTETYSYSIAATEDQVTTDAGTFDCLKMTVTDSEGDYDVYWYSSDVGSWVKLSTFSEGESTPYMTLELTEYEYSAGSETMMILIIGLGILVAVVVIVVVLLMMRKRGQAPVGAPQQMPPPPPPPAV